MLRRVRLSQANQSSAQIPTVDKQQLDREGDQPQGAKLQQLAKRVGDIFRDFLGRVLAITCNS